MVFVDPCRQVGGDVIFANGFETGGATSGDVIFCNGFEQLLGRVTAAKSFAQNANNVAAALWRAATDAMAAVRAAAAIVGSELTSVSALHGTEHASEVTERAWHLPYSRLQKSGESRGFSGAGQSAVNDTNVRQDASDRFSDVAVVWLPDRILREWQSCRE